MSEQLLRVHREATAMRRIFGILLGTGLILGLASGARAQGWGYYPPAGGQMYYYPPVYTSPSAVGGQYVETFPTYAGNAFTPGVYAAQPTVPSHTVPAGPPRRARAGPPGPARTSVQPRIQPGGRSRTPTGFRRVSSTGLDRTWHPVTRRSAATRPMAPGMLKVHTARTFTADTGRDGRRRSR